MVKTKLKMFVNFQYSSTPCYTMRDFTEPYYYFIGVVTNENVQRLGKGN